VLWNEDAVLQAADTVEFGGILWILHLAGNTDVGIGKTSDLHTQESSVRSYAKNEGLDDPGIPIVREGYKNISRKTVVDGEGNRGTINHQHKPTIVSLTPLGKGLMKTVDNDDRILKSLKGSIGIEVDEPQDPWWPGEGPRESNELFLYTYDERTVLDEEECEIDAHAIFSCKRCGEDITSDFQITLQQGNIVDGWGKLIEAECDSCGTSYEHSAADPHRKPDLS